MKRVSVQGKIKEPLLYFVLYGLSHDETACFPSLSLWGSDSSLNTTGAARSEGGGRAVFP